MEWTEDTISRLRALWSDGHSTAEIGRRLGISKNAVVGKAHRLDLPARPSPIRRDGPRLGPRPGPRRVAGPTLPPLPSAERPAPAIAMAPGRTEPRTPIPPPLANPPRALPLPSRPYGRTVACCWPIGEPGTKEFRFCDEISVPGKPYCARHVQLAYVKLRDRREDAA
ncbi:MAG: GcrA family cell cycle regulator [Alphaproteobacteria bacterium]|nr:GcrA family cell cycle regulator [Alphaproteobacteria bacterium]